MSKEVGKMAHKVTEDDESTFMIVTTCDSYGDNETLFSSPVYYDADFGLCYVRHTSLVTGVIIDFADQLERKLDE